MEPNEPSPQHREQTNQSPFASRPTPGMSASATPTSASTRITITVFAMVAVVAACLAAIGLQPFGAAESVASATTESESSSSSPSSSSWFREPNNPKHPLEDNRSWELHRERRPDVDLNTNTNDGAGAGVASILRKRRRRMESISETIQYPTGKKEEYNNNDENEDDDDGQNDDDDDDRYELPFEIRHKHPQKHVPFAGGDTTHGIMIDAGSQGTRLHVYEWKQRILLDEEDLIEQMKGMKLSYPTSNNRWTDKYTPGLDAFGSIENSDRLEQAVRTYLGALLDFAKQVLRDKEDMWNTYPIYLKATGGLRTLPQPERVRLMDCVRKLFHDPSFNPFDFEDERARVISGEEEAIYGWVGVNFAKRRLIQSSRGSGIGKDPKLTYGMLEMGGASTQIASFENNGDLMANLFKLQLGGARHWNVYVHSYLYFGINGAWARLNAQLRADQKTTNPCLPLGSSVDFDSWIHMNEHAQFIPRSDPRSTPYTATMENLEEAFDFKDCSDHTLRLLRKQTNHDWCDFQMDQNCGFAGIYQPPMPQHNSEIDEFIATSNFYDVYAFLQLGERATIARIGDAAESVCRLPWKKLKEYNTNNPQYFVKTDNELAQFCFRSIFVYHLLRNGWEFGDNYELTAVDVIDGHKLGWALGCMLYEINTLPWGFHPELLYKGPNWFVFRLYVFFGTLVGSLVGLMIAMRVSKSLNKSVRESMYFKTHPGFANNLVVRKTLSLPDVGVNFDELDRLYEQDDRQRQKQLNGKSTSPSCCSSSTEECETNNERTELSNQSGFKRVTYA